MTLGLILCYVMQKHSSFFPFDHIPPLYTVQYFAVPILSLAIFYDLMAWHCLILLILTPITEMGYNIGY